MSHKEFIMLLLITGKDGRQCRFRVKQIFDANDEGDGVSEYDQSKIQTN